MSELTESQIDRINVILNEVPAPKPVEKKIIDLTKMVGSGVDMEFNSHDVNWNIGILEKISPLGHINHPYSMLNAGVFKRCRVRQNHIHYYNGIGNPLPDGLLVRIYFIDYDYMPPYDAKSQDINWDDLHYIKGFEVLEVLSEYKYGWEK